MSGIDVLMIAHRRADYLSLSLPRLLSTLPSHARLWMWQNGEDPEVTAVIDDHRDHPRFHHFEHRPVNAGVNPPTRWFWTRAQGALLGKVDDDCLVPPGWVERFEQAHHDAPELGVVACWHFQPEDLWPRSVATRATTVGGGHTILRNCWVGGSGYLLKRECVVERPEDDTKSFTGVCIDIAAQDWVVGWYHPLVVQDHMDDPRSPNTRLLTDGDLRQRMPLSASRLEAPTLEAWQRQLEQSAAVVQTASLRPRDHRGWRRRVRALRARLP